MSKILILGLEYWISASRTTTVSADFRKEILLTLAVFNLPAGTKKVTV